MPPYSLKILAEKRQFVTKPIDIKKISLTGNTKKNNDAFLANLRRLKRLPIFLPARSWNGKSCCWDQWGQDKDCLRMYFPTILRFWRKQLKIHPPLYLLQTSETSLCLFESSPSSCKHTRTLASATLFHFRVKDFVSSRSFFFSTQKRGGRDLLLLLPPSPRYPPPCLTPRLRGRQCQV